jgi:signal-transduction protein with cAMP-binding, CBS, and nucleotidyltransferase domain
MAHEREIIWGCFHDTQYFAENLFDKLPPEFRKSLSKIKQIKEFQEKRIVIAKGKLPNIYVLREGQAKINFFNQINQKNVAQLIEKDRIIGLTETIGNFNFKMKVKTITPCVFEFIKQKDFLKLLYNEPEVCFQLVKMLSLDLNNNYKTFYSSTF